MFTNKPHTVLPVDSSFVEIRLEHRKFEGQVTPNQDQCQEIFWLKF